MTKKLMMLVALMATLSGSAWAKNLAELQTEELSQYAMSARVESDKTYVVNIHYVGSSTEAVVTIETDKLTFYAPYNVADDSIGSSGVVDLNSTSYDTMGEMCDYIEAQDDYECDLLGAKRDDDSSSFIKTQTQTSGTNDLKTAGGVDFYVYEVTTGYTLRLGMTPRSGKRVILYQCTANANVADTIRVHGKLKKYEGSVDGVTRNDTTLVFKAATADDTDKTVPSATPIIPWLEFAPDEHVVVSAGHGTGIQASGNSLTCLWMEK